MMMHLLDFLSIDIDVEETMRRISENSHDKRFAEILFPMEKISYKPKKPQSLVFILV